MDWAQFLQTNAASFFTAIGVLLGILGTAIVSMLRNRFEASEREKDRVENQKELATALEVELLKADIATLTQAIDNALKSLDFQNDLRLKQDIGKITEDERIEQLRLASLEESGRLHQLSELDSVSTKLAYAFGEKFRKESEKFDDAWFEYACYIRDRESYMDKEDTFPEDKALYEKVATSAANLHLMLREKLVSVRRGQTPGPRKPWLQKWWESLEL